MKVNTRKFGEIDIDKEKVLMMPEGLPGFPGFDRFVLIEDSKTAPFCWFQSIEAPHLSFIVMNPVVFKPDYKLDLQDLIDNRGWKNVRSEELLIFVVVNIKEGEDGKIITANLMGPLVINLENNEVIQMAISDPEYSHQYNVLEALK